MRTGLLADPFPWPVVPFYTDGPSQHYKGFGSGTLIIFSGHCYVLTAAHVLDTMTGAPFFIFCVDTLYRMFSVRTMKSPLVPPMTTRQDDPFDLAIFALPDE